MKSASFQAPLSFQFFRKACERGKNMDGLGLVDLGWVLSLAGTVTLGKLFNLFVSLSFLISQWGILMATSEELLPAALTTHPEPAIL